jgi:hypothetical protein
MGTGGIPVPESRRIPLSAGLHGRRFDACNPLPHQEWRCTKRPGVLAGEPARQAA